jgi:alpha-beta hydrolase superfamily lysophospholipase
MIISAIAICFIAIACLLAGLIAAMIVFGAAPPPKPMDSISALFEQMNYHDLPAIETFPARDGTALAYRRYAGGGDRVAVLVHGSAGGCSSMHVLAKALQAAGITVYALDIRGHGASGPHGDIAYVGQLDDDLADFRSIIRARHPAAQIALIGFSSGGGYVLRVAGSSIGGLFDNYVLISPYLGHKSPTQRPNSGGWAVPYIPRLIALSILDRFGIHLFAGLPVLAFAVQPGMEKILTATYSYRLSRNFQPSDDYLEDFRRTTKPMVVLVGEADEAFYAGRFDPLIHKVRPDIDVTVVPGLGHIEMNVKPRGVAAVVEALSATTPKAPR